MKTVRGTHTHTFSELPCPEIDLALEFSYYHDPGRFSGPPENCYPPETDQWAELPEDWHRQVILAYLDAAKQAIVCIEKEVERLNESDEIEEWARAEMEDQAAAADYYFDGLREDARL